MDEGETGKGKALAYGKDDCADVVVEARCPDSLLVRLGSASLLGQHESRTNPYSTSAEHERRSDRLPVEKSTCSNDLHLIACQGTLLTLDYLCYSRYEDRCRHVTSMSAALAALGTNHVGAHVKAFLDVLRVANHVHVEDTVLVESIYDMFRRNADSGDEKLSTGINDYGNEVVQFPFRVIIATQNKLSALHLRVVINCHPTPRSSLLRLTSVTADLWD